MLNELIIKNLAVIEQLHLSFAPGFTVLSGETGAGKSIIIDAMGLVLGQRMRSDLVRSGCDSASVEAVFDIADHRQVMQRLAAMDLAAEDELIIKRTLTSQGKSRVYINGSPATLAQLQQIMATVVAIFGQHDQQQLQRSENHLLLLDAYAGNGEVLAEYRRYYAAVQQLQQELDGLRGAAAQRQQRQQELEFCIDEIRRVEPQPGEDEELEAQRLKLQHAERLYSGCQNGYEQLYAADGAMCERLGAVLAQLDGLEQIAPELQGTVAALNDAMFTLEDAATQLRAVATAVVFDEQLQQQVEQRLADIAALQRKYHPHIDGILAALEQMEQELELLRGGDDSIRRLEDEISAARERMLAQGRSLSQRRREAAGRLRQAVQRELATLAMPDASFMARCLPLEQPGAAGLERVEFYFSANPGQQPRPLASTASGGELSRIMLALRNSAPDVDNLATIVFDEVDAGVGGVAATAVGERLCAVAAHCQVLCITHLPQIAAYADQQLRVEKRVENGQTNTTVAVLDEEQRVEELARMLAGAQRSSETLAHARELLRCSRQPGLFDQLNERISS